MRLQPASMPPTSYLRGCQEREGDRHTLLYSPRRHTNAFGVSHCIFDVRTSLADTPKNNNQGGLNLSQRIQLQFDSIAIICHLNLTVYRQLQNHPLAYGFQQAISAEINALQSMGTWQEVSPEDAIHNNKTPIPTRWLFKYKFDNQGYFTNYRARLCARGDLQKTETDTYAATLAARIFRALVVIVNTFDLETREYDAVSQLIPRRSLVAADFIKDHLSS